MGWDVWKSIRVNQKFRFNSAYVAWVVLFDSIPITHTPIRTRTEQNERRRNFTQISRMEINPNPVVNHNGKQWRFRMRVYLNSTTTINGSPQLKTKRNEMKNPTHKNVRYVGHRANRSRMFAKVSNKSKNAFFLSWKYKYFILNFKRQTKWNECAKCEYNVHEGSSGGAGPCTRTQFHIERFAHVNAFVYLLVVAFSSHVKVSR